MSKNYQLEKETINYIVSNIDKDLDENVSFKKLEKEVKPIINDLLEENKLSRDPQNYQGIWLKELLKIRKSLKE